MISVLRRRSVANSVEPRWLKRRVRRVMKALGVANHDLCIVLTGDSEIQDLNRQYRELDKPTDVLSFPQLVEDEFEVCSDEAPHLGDVVISVQQAAEQSKRGCLPRLQNSLDAIPNDRRDGVDWTVKEEVLFLALHGVLHLVGYDHVTDSEADEMEGLEAELLPLILTRHPSRSLPAAVR